MEVTRRSALAGAATAGVAGAGALGLSAAEGVFGGSGNTASVDALVAGSLAALAAEVPGAVVEAHGSVAARRLVVDGLRDPDAVALADPALFAGLPGVDGHRLFATNALVLAYDPDSTHAAALGRDWAGTVARRGVRVGRTDPTKDPLGYRTLLAMRLAAREGLLAPAVARRVVEDAGVFPETALLQHVAVGELNAAFAYRNMAQEVGLPAVDLPASVDLSDPALADAYRRASVTVDGRTYRGGPIRYAAAARTAAGEDWVTDLVTGHERLRDHGFTVPAEYPRETSR